MIQAQSIAERKPVWPGFRGKQLKPPESRGKKGPLSIGDIFGELNNNTAFKKLMSTLKARVDKLRDARENTIESKVREQLDTEIRIRKKLITEIENIVIGKIKNSNKH